MKTFKNEKERREFLNDYTNADLGWSLWKSIPELSRRWWTAELDTDLYIVVEDQRVTYHYPTEHQAWQVLRWYITPKSSEEPFADFQVSKTHALEKLKELSRK